MRASGRSSTCVVDGGNVTALDHSNIPVSRCLIRARLFSTNHLRTLFWISLENQTGQYPAGKKGLKGHLDVSEIPEERVDAASFLPPHPYGRYLFEAITLLDWFHRSFDADLVERSLPHNRIGDLLAEDFEAVREVAKIRPEKKLEKLLKNPIQNVLDRIIVNEAAPRQPSVGDYTVAARFQNLIHHAIHGGGLRLQIGGHEGHEIPRRCLHALAVGPADARIVLLD